MRFYNYIKGIWAVPVLVAWAVVAIVRLARLVYSKATATTNRG